VRGVWALVVVSVLVALGFGATSALAQTTGQPAPTMTSPSALESALQTLRTPTVAYLLLALGFLGLWLEFSNPGAIVPGVVGGSSVLVAFLALGALPLNAAGVALLGLGLVLFALEPFIPSHGVLAVGGLGAFVAGSLLLIDTTKAPNLQIEPAAIAGVSGVLAVFATVIVAAIVRTRRARSLTGREGLVGATGVVRRTVGRDDMGLVLVQGELWQALAPAGPIQTGEAVVVERNEGLRLTVRRAAGPRALRPASPAAAKSAGQQW
jgi:membrane-bound serine protease (ClpP class)